MRTYYKNATWDYYPSKCRAPACRCDSPCDDIGGTYVCTQCGKNQDYCSCKRNDCGCFTDDCIHCGDCGEPGDECECDNIKDEHERDLRKDGGK